MAESVIGVDLAEVVDDSGEHRTTLAWGDPVQVLDEERGASA